MLPFLIALPIAIVLAVAGAMIYKRNMHIWLPAYVAGFFRKRKKAAGVTHIIVAIADHFEPITMAGKDPHPKEGCMDDWLGRFPELAAKHRDSDGRPPRHTWAYPLEIYDPAYIEQLLTMCRKGFGEIEVQLHHNDTSESFRKRMNEGLANYAKHGVNVIKGETHFAFVHGNWALDNSRPDGRWCGVNDEITQLRELGCFADATLPSAPNPTQTAKINSIYYATDNPAKPKSHNSGVDVEVGKPASGDLMIIQGPLGIDWKTRREFPMLENAALTDFYPGNPIRIRHWIKTGIHVKRRPEWIFVKLHSHGATDRESQIGKPADEMFSYFETHYASGSYQLHYVTLREMYNIIKAAEAGKTGNPNDYRDYIYPPYDCTCSVSA